MLRQIYQFLNPRYQNLYLEYKVDLRPRYGYGKPPHQLLYDIINKDRKEYALLLNEAAGFKEIFQAIKIKDIEKDPVKPAYNNGYLPGLDMVMLYTMITHYKPHIYFEIGSGNSTQIAYKAIQENALSTKIISVDPEPRAEIDRIAGTIIRKPFEDVDYEEIFSLKENDILFIDNSHRILPNSDSMVFFMEIMPRIKKGIIVHLHDIYLPYDYPQFMCDRFYSEQYGLAMYLLANSKKYKPIMPNYFVSQDPELSKILHPVWDHPALEDVEQHGGSFWLSVV